MPKWDLVYFHRLEGQKRFIKGLVSVEPFWNFLAVMNPLKHVNVGWNIKLQIERTKERKLENSMIYITELIYPPLK